jgi:hypothetical protein
MPETTIEADAMYRVRMKKATKYEHEWFRPGAHKIVVRGHVLEDIKDSVLDYEKVS